MTPQTLARLANDLDTAADLVEAIDGAARRFDHGWNLQDWSYELVPWGVRFTHRDERRNMRTEVIVRLAGPVPFRPSTTTLFTRDFDDLSHRCRESAVAVAETEKDR